MVRKGLPGLAKFRWEGRWGSLKFAQVLSGSLKFIEVRQGSFKLAQIRYGAVRQGWAKVREGSLRFADGSLRFAKQGSLRFAGVRQARFAESVAKLRQCSVRFAQFRYGAKSYSEVRKGSLRCVGFCWISRWFAEVRHDARVRQRYQGSWSFSKVPPGSVQGPLGFSEGFSVAVGFLRVSKILWGLPSSCQFFQEFPQLIPGSRRFFEDLEGSLRGVQIPSFTPSLHSPSFVRVRRDSRVSQRFWWSSLEFAAVRWGPRR